MPERLMAAPAVERPRRVYNLVFDPITQDDPIVLAADRTTAVEFAIGPPRVGSVLPQVDIDSRIVALADNQKTPIDVRMVCDICNKDQTQWRTMEFDPELRESTAARFEIVPSLARVHDQGRLGALYFTLHMKGYELNHIEVNAFVGAVNPERLADYRKPRIDFVPLPGDAGAPPDLIISVTPESAAGHVAVALEANLPELRQALDPLVRDHNRKTWRKFTLDFGAATPNDLSQRAVEAYKRLRQMTAPQGELRDRLTEFYRAAGSPVFMATFPSDALKLIPQHRDMALLSFKEAGQDLYRALFSRLFSPSPNLESAIRAVENFRLERPLKISIETPYFLPWQLLYPNFEDTAANAVDRLKFWGFKYELSVRQIVRGQRDRLDAAARRPRSQDVLFAKGKALRGNDPVVTFAEDLYRDLDAPFAATPRQPVPLVDSGETFINSLTDTRDDLQLVFLFSHATSGNYVMLASNATVTVADDIGPRIQFASDEFVTPRRIERIYDTAQRLPVWSRQPIFVLNGCETGAGGVQPANSGLFVSTLIRLGANAVVVTESEIWTKFANAWAKTLITELRSGSDMAKAVRQARVAHLDHNNNPMGLLYSLYGSPSARVEFRPN